ncbi:hypothetical protein FB451DRAFT_1550754 [Mycena latifolia]|nr:hypothetical protein FB451DRAFT_1550754 [Mycena latifolia]
MAASSAGVINTLWPAPVGRKCYCGVPVGQPVRPRDERRAVDRAHDALVAPDLTRTVSQLNAAVQIFLKITLVEASPLVHAKLALQKVSMYELAIHLEGTWKGAHMRLKLLLFMAPFRWSATISKATEAPTKRAVLLASYTLLFSMRGGGRYHGAEYLGPALLKRFGLDAFTTIVDEGGAFSQNFGALFTVPGVTEEGSVNEDIRVW